ncbi:MAG: hypothetical protein ACPGNV_16415, partial [Mangrovicoccus sp.]
LSRSSLISAPFMDGCGATEGMIGVQGGNASRDSAIFPTLYYAAVNAPTRKTISDRPFFSIRHKFCRLPNMAKFTAN